MQTVVVVSLAHDVIKEEISANAKVRCGAALWKAWEANSSSYTEAVLACGAGVIPGSGSSKTLAEYTEDYFRKVRADLPLLVNHDDIEVYGTLNEIRWVIQAAQERYDNPRFVIVSQARHIHRVKLMHHWFFPNALMEFVVSGQTEEIPLWYECFAYSKLVLLTFGFGRLAEKLRRFTARFTKW